MPSKSRRRQQSICCAGLCGVAQPPWRRHRFGQSIPSLIHLAAPEFGIRQIGYRTENAGAIMADAYARISHKVGVVTAQNGPAATFWFPPSPRR